MQTEAMLIRAISNITNLLDVSLKDFKHSCDYIYYHLFVSPRRNRASIVLFKKWYFPRPNVQQAQAIPGNRGHAQLLKVEFCHWVGYLGQILNFMGVLEGNQMEKNLLCFFFFQMKAFALT